jgi:hypothetical protein
MPVWVAMIMATAALTALTLLFDNMRDIRDPS